MTNCLLRGAQTKARGSSVNAPAGRWCWLTEHPLGRETQIAARDRELAFRRLGGEHVIDRVREIIHPGHRDDDHVAMALAVLGDAEEFAPAIFPQIDREKLPLDLQLSCFNNAVHF